MENKVGINGLDKAGNTALYWGCHGGHKGNNHWMIKILRMYFLVAPLDGLEPQNGSDIWIFQICGVITGHTLLRQKLQS